jgi:hypothetical protein
VDGEGPFDSLTGDDAPNREHLAGAGTSMSGHDAGVDLNAFLAPFQNPRMDFDGVANFKFQFIRPITRRFGVFDQFMHRDFLSARPLFDARRGYLGFPDRTTGN